MLKANTHIHSISTKRKGFIATIVKYRYLYLMALPVVLFYIIFHYIPMYGIVIGFMDYSPSTPFFQNEWVGLKHFISFFEGIFFGRIFRNTLMLNVYGLIFGFPSSVILALMLNEVRNRVFKKTVQTITYIPHFISTVIVVGIAMSLVSYDGAINELRGLFGLKKIHFMTEPNLFYPIYIISHIWQHLGWESIIFLSAITGIDITLYDAAYVDGASRWKQMLYVTLPGIYPTIAIMLILNLGGMLSVGFERVFLMYNPSIYSKADVISTYVYRYGLVHLNYSYSAAVGFFSSVVNFLLLVIANYSSRFYSEHSLW
jgi:putative aldouronate transport system permease protein